MDLIATRLKPPPEAIVSPVVSKGGAVLRSARWMPLAASEPPAASPGTVLICPGRSEFIEKYYEVIGELRARGFAVVIFDWRGQGASARALHNPLKGHVGSFAEFGRDLAAVVQQVLEPFCPQPWHALAHSMGGAVTLHFAADRPEVFDRVVLSAPMTALAGLCWPNLARLAANVLAYLGAGRAYIPVGRRRALFLSTFPGNVLTSDQDRFDRVAELLEACPALALGAPTIGWIRAAFDSMAALQEDDFVRSLATPTLFVLAGDDAVVDTRAAERLSARLRASTAVVVRGARHEILMERDALRDQFWAAFDAFIPSARSHGERDRVPTRDSCVA